MTRSLATLATGTSARVLALQGDYEFAPRLRELGFVPGTIVQVRRRAPMRDPVELELRGTRLCLRRQELARIAVELLAQ